MVVFLIVASAWLTGLALLVGLRLRATRPGTDRIPAGTVAPADGTRARAPGPYRAHLRAVQGVARSHAVAPSRTALTGRRA